MLAILLVAGNEVVSPDQLVDRLWGEQPPRTARNTLYGYLHRLRKRLADAVPVAHGRSAYRRPLIVAVPSVGRVMPTATRIVVDFPAPFGPRNPVTRPGRTTNDRPSTAVFPPYFLVSAVTSIMPMTLGSERPRRVCHETSPGGGHLCRWS